MNKLCAAVALLALLSAGRGAGAAEAVGWITKLDGQSDRIILDDGRAFNVSEEINFSTLRDGVRVRLYYETFGDQKVVTDIAPAPEMPQKAQLPRPRTEKPACGGYRMNRWAKNLTVPPDIRC